MALILFIICSFLSNAKAYQDTVIPPSLRAPYNSIPGNRAVNLDNNIRLLTVLALQQNGWQLYGDHWYRLYETDLMWMSAENFCRSMGGHLVSIKDRAENDFVHALRKKNHIWIGLNKINDSRQVYKWSDGTAAEYINWDSTQPNEPKIRLILMTNGNALPRTEDATADAKEIQIGIELILEHTGVSRLQTLDKNRDGNNKISSFDDFNSFNTVDCVYMAYNQENRGTWFDYGCWEHQPQYFVCKLPTP